MDQESYKICREISQQADKTLSHLQEVCFPLPQPLFDAAREAIGEWELLCLTLAGLSKEIFEEYVESGGE